jgi:GNAT superfamily N-acetyltransferase
VTNDTALVGLVGVRRDVVPTVPDTTQGWSETHEVDGRSVTLRPIRDDDVDRLRRLFFRLSPETVYLRFFQAVRAPSEKLLHHLAEVDHDRRQAVVAVDGDEIVGVARYDRGADAEHAEVAVLVEDAWQGHGLGTVLLRRLGVEALEHGFVSFTATVLGDNRRALVLAHHMSPAAHSHIDHGEWYLDIPLSA